MCWTGPTKVLRRESLGVKWCFICRKRVEFIYTITTEIEMSYHDPWPSIECVPAGHSNGDLFPGYIREWDEE